MTTRYCNNGNGSTTGFWGITAWATGVSTPTGTIVRATAPSSGNERAFRNNGGTFTTGALQPTWNLGNGATTADNGGTWTEVTGNATYAWTACFALLETAYGRSSADDIIYLGDDHTQTLSQDMNSGISADTSVLNVISVDHTVASPTASDVKTGAAFTNNSSKNWTGSWYFNGLTFSSGSTGGFNVTSNRVQIYENCTISQNGSSQLGATGTYTEFINTAYNPTSGLGQLFTSSSSGGRFIWRDTASAVGGSGATNMFSGGNFTEISLINVDISGLTGAILAVVNNPVQINLSRVKTASGFGGTNGFGSGLGYGRVVCFAAANGADTEAHSIYDTLGTLTNSLAVIRTGGANDSIAGYSEKIVTGAGVKFRNLFVGEALHKWNAAIGSNATVTVYAISNTSAIPTNGDLWPEVRYFGSASSPVGSVKTGSKSNMLTIAANWSADTSAWDTLATARANSHTQAVGDAISVSSNSGRVFFCTAIGSSPHNTASSLPGGYATAVDGGTVTDGDCTFRAGWRIAMVVTLTSPQPQLAGFVTVQMKFAAASSTYYVDPGFTLT